MVNNKDIRDILKNQEQRLKQELSIDTLPTHEIVTREYKEFRESFLPKPLNWYEKLCKISEKTISIKLKPEDEKILNEHIRICHLNINPQGVIALSFILPIIIMILGFLFSLLIIGSLFLSFFFIFVGIAGIFVLKNIPAYYSNAWRMKASNQMVLCIFYIVTYMRHTSNFERAINFGSEHLLPPLALDLKKVLWDVENGVYKNIKDSLEAYLETWRKWNKEFIEAFHLIESSLYEPSEERRQEVLDKSLDRILEETSEKMTHYAQNLKSPITLLHMLGVILPILGLVILPLIVSFSENVRWWHLSIIYNFALPIIVFVLGKNILSTRPTGYGDTDVTQFNPEYKRFTNIILKIGSKEYMFSPIAPALLIGIVFLFTALSPVILHTIVPDFDITIPLWKTTLNLFDYKNSSTVFERITIFEEGAPIEKTIPAIVGPFGIGASLLSLFFPLAFALSISLYYNVKTKKIVKIRDTTKKIEGEFSDSLFQLGNRLADGLPPEIAFEKVAAVVEDSTTGDFFRAVTTNIRKYGMSVNQAIFNPKTGAVLHYPSNIIISSMKVLVESSKKGPRIAAKAVQSVSQYVKQIHHVNERLKDLLADILSDMKTQISFITPIIAGIVIGITSMITFILSNLTKTVQQFGSDASSGFGNVLNMFGDGLPTYDFQMVVGIYVVQIVYLLTIISNGIEHGADKLSEQNLIAKNIKKSTLLYCIFSAILMIIFNLIAVFILCRGMNKC
ncbi:hypothetical protein HYV79_05065 [Candidatus Woesearchaeota archaeon]|nr:hypothetical protein [Candidatus Woesearchaeota archaeon]